MKLLGPAAVLAIVLASQAIQLAPAAADECVVNPYPYTPVTGLPSDGYPICYEKPADPKYTKAFDDLQKRQILERYAQFLSPLKLPHKLTLKSMQCASTWSPYYSSGDRTLHFCYEFYEKVLNLAPTATTPQGVTRENVITGTWIAVLLHETGHALFDMLNVPVFGREEDAADEMASFIATQFDKDVERTVIKGFAYFWQSLAQRGADPSKAAMSPNDPNYPKDAAGRCAVNPFCVYEDVHGTASQRLYNALCLGYGADQETFKDFVQMGWLPKERAANCASEYRLLKFAFAKTIFPFIDQDRMKKVQANKWLAPDELK
jgi:hypothetical protein